jgi:long-chain acyl-CoA synthetase
VTLARLLADAAARVPDRPALVSAGVTATFAELDKRAARAAGALDERGVASGDRVAFVLPNTVSSVAAFHGTLRLGAVPVPLNPLLSEHEIGERVRESGATLFAVDDLEGDPFAARATPAPDDVAVVLYTSGSTGRPKRIELTHGGLRLSADATASALGLNEQDVLLGAPPLSHVFGMTGCMNGSIAAGACLLLISRFDATSALATIERNGVTVLMGVPAMCVSLLAASYETGRAPSLRLAHVGGAPLPDATRHAFQERFGARVLEGYGMTEAGGAVAIQRADQPSKPDSVGSALAGALRIADDGEVLVRAPTLARGIDGWLRTGDIGRLDEDGDLFLLDRKKDIVLRGGYTVYPREVEEALVAHPAVREAVVIGIPHATLGEEVAAVVVAIGRCDPNELKAFVRERVAAYKYPRVIEFVDRLPYGPTGKVERKAALELLGTRGRPAS